MRCLNYGTHRLLGSTGRGGTITCHARVAITLLAIQARCLTLIVVVDMNSKIWASTLDLFRSHFCSRRCLLFFFSSLQQSIIMCDRYQPYPYANVFPVTPPQEFASIRPAHRTNRLSATAATRFTPEAKATVWVSFNVLHDSLSKAEA